MKSENCTSGMGRNPLKDAPKAMPIMEASAKGVSMTLDSPNSSKKP